MYSCDKDPKKTCPAKRSVHIDGNGVVSQSSSALLKCCKVQDQLERARKYFGDGKDNP